MTIARIAEVLRTKVKDGLLALKDAAIADGSLGSVLSLLPVQELNLLGVTITTTDNSVTVTGSSSLLGAADIDLEAAFTEHDGTITFSLSAKGNSHLLGSAPALADPVPSLTDSADCQQD